MARNRDTRKVTLDPPNCEVADRARWYVRQRFDRDASKRLQAELDISESTADRILSGEISYRVLLKMLRAWGWSFNSFVFELICGPAPDVMQVALHIEETKRLAERHNQLAEEIQDALHRAASSAVLRPLGETVRAQAGDVPALVDVVDRPHQEIAEHAQRQAAI